MEQEQYFLFIRYVIKDNSSNGQRHHSHVISGVYTQLVFEPGVKYYRIPVDFDTIDVQNKDVFLAIGSISTYDNDYGPIDFLIRPVAAFLNKEDADKFSLEFSKGDHKYLIKSSDKIHSCNVVKYIIS
jgi:hypothetical protein